MRLAMDVERGSLWIGAETNRAVLMGHARERDTIPEEQISGEQALVAIMTVHVAPRLLAHQPFQFGGETGVRFLVIRRVLQHDPAVAIESYAVVRVGQILDRKSVV